MKRDVAIANFAYAGTNKYVTHAITDDETKTLCGMDVDELIERKTGEWELIVNSKAMYNNEPIIIGCLKCSRKPTPAA